MYIETTNPDSKVTLFWATNYKQLINLEASANIILRNTCIVNEALQDVLKLGGWILSLKIQGLIAHYHTALQMNHTDDHAGARSIRYGSSPTNSVRKIYYLCRELSHGGLS